MTNAIKWQLPGWVANFVATWETGFASMEQRMEFVARLAMTNVALETGGPFGAAIFNLEDNQLVAPGINLVTTVNASIAHAEMVAISLAQTRLGTFNLAEAGRFELVTSVEPCAMCLGAVPWSGVCRLVCGATAADAEAIGFDEGSKPEQWLTSLRDRGIEVYTGVESDRAGQALREYARRGGPIYNGAQPLQSEITVNKNESNEENNMSVARVTEIIASSNKSFEDAVQNGIERATKTLKNVRGAWVESQKVDVKDGKIKEYRVSLKVTFVLND